MIADAAVGAPTRMTEKELEEALSRLQGGPDPTFYGHPLLDGLRAAVQKAREEFRIPLSKTTEADRELDRLRNLLKENHWAQTRIWKERRSAREKGQTPSDWSDEEEQVFQHLKQQDETESAESAREREKWQRIEKERQREADLKRTAFAERRNSKGVKPANWKPEWDRDWNKAYNPRRNYWDFGQWEKTLGRFIPRTRDFSLGDAAQDSDQENLFSALEDYFDGFPNVDRKLHAIHNVMLKLRTIANECHVMKGRE